MIIEGEPVPKARPRLGKNGNIYTPKASRVYEELVAWYAKRLPIYDGDVLLNVTFYCSPSRKLPDLDRSSTRCACAQAPPPGGARDAAHSIRHSFAFMRCPLQATFRFVYALPIDGNIPSTIGVAHI
jgi:hypothetical protein